VQRVPPAQGELPRAAHPRHHRRQATRDYLIAYDAKKNTILNTLAHQISGALYLGGHLADEMAISMNAGNAASATDI
jgi:hypothetical protein